MSTRRARIKAVNFLPLRRKNTETSENKNKASDSKDNAEKNSKDSQTPLPSASANQEENTSVIKNTPDNQNSSTNTPSKEQSFNKSPATNSTTPGETPHNANNSTSFKDKAQSINSIKDTNIFVSPLRRNSPKKTFASPIVPSPKVIRNVEQKLTTTLIGRKTPVAQKINESNELQISGSVINITHNITNDSRRNEQAGPGTPTIANDEAMDGIIPLQSASTAPKPIELLKSEIISENAEVLFDPIVPLPSPSKVRPKLRPAPRLGPHRRNSVQGSASESEDESRRSLLSGGNTPAHQRQRHDSQMSHNTLVSLPNRDVSRVRNDSVCSGVSVITKPQPTSPVKEKHTKRSRNERRLNAMRRRENVKRDSLTMYDLIFYNPTSNPIVPDDDEINAKEANEKEILESNKKEETKTDNPKENAAPVPQIKLGPNGTIMIDEESLVIKQTESDRKVSSVVHEGSWSKSSGYKAKHLRSRDWSSAETVRFYRALAVIGTDFSLMAPLFPDRTRRELKFKFKKEERMNGAQVDKALRSTIEWDVLRLKEEFKEERALAAKQAERERQSLIEEKKLERERLKAARETRVRSSRGSKALSSNMLPGLNKVHNEVFTADGIIERANRRPHKNKHGTIQASDKNKDNQSDVSQNTQNQDVAVLTKLPPMQTKTPEAVNTLPPIPPNIETGSLVVLTVDDPSSPAKKMLQTYIARGPGQLTPVALPTTFLNSVVGYMKKNKGQGSPQIMSPGSAASYDSRSSGTPGVPNISVLPSPAKRQRHSSFTITQL
ncbi:uncharacterized protein LOC116771661 [Danaus plexippus]|uniref:uncharacterized protein LOC116771661 n=1 Tax=Danaus plexippus TaxID=13037 RepID=UPI002AB21D62|nr:uncharacterized protein LOC116771661 [Danaus plexippus]